MTPTSTKRSPLHASLPVQYQALAFMNLGAVFLSEGIKVQAYRTVVLQTHLVLVQFLEIL